MALVRTLYLTAILIYTAVFMSCLSEPDFDEALWLERVNAVDPQMLFADNRNENGKFFNPWMPMSGEQDTGMMFRYIFGRRMSFPNFDAEKYSSVENQYDYLSDPNFDSISFVGHASMFIKLMETQLSPIRSSPTMRGQLERKSG